MLDLQPRVHLQEGELAMLVEQELDRSRVGVARGARQAQGGLTHARAQAGVHRWRRALFDQLLVTALNAAFAFAEVHQAAVLVTQDLDLDMARPSDVALEEDAVIAE